MKRDGKVANAGKDDDERSVSAIYLAEVFTEINEGASFLDRLSLAEIREVRRASTTINLEAGASVFTQGALHCGIYLIESGRVRTYYAGPSGKELTLAYWTPGHFVGGPEVFGGGVHMWSATAMEASRLTRLPGPAILHLAKTIPAFAICLIDGLVAKGKCYSALVQMLGTRSVAERLAHLLVILAESETRPDSKKLIIRRKITHEQIANIVGSTRQWVTITMARFQKQGLVSVERDSIIIEDKEGLRQIESS
jgi:CRP/FNR family transcriptional regulator, cyclic AMP receptor protein